MADANGPFSECLRAPGFFTNPYPLYYRLRSEDPVHWSEEWGCWLVTRYDDVLAILTDPARFFNAGCQSGILDRFPGAEREALGPLARHYASGGLINADPPDHTRLRKLVLKAFTPRIVEQMKSDIQAVVDKLLAPVADGESLDIIRDFAYPLPAIVIAQILGVPAADRDKFKRWSDEIAGFVASAPVTFERAMRAQAGLVAMQDYFRGMLAERRARPFRAPDLLSHLASAEEDGDFLSEEELLATCVILLVAGHETTTNLIGKGMLALMRHPEQLHELKCDPSLLPTAIEELLRYDGPLQWSRRTVTEDITLRGKRLKRGEQVMAMLGAANRDPEQFPEPDHMDIKRRANRHVAFGYGIHFCVGAPLARLEGRIAFETLLRRLPRLASATVSPAWREGIIRRLAALPVRFA